MRPVFLLSDFGPQSFYQGVMKGVISSISPETPIHDLGHGLPAGQIKEAGFVVEISLDHLPEEAILVVVVDPGVGSGRRILAASFGGRTVLAPDNGLLTPLFARPDRGAIHAVSNKRYLKKDPAATFHGRDIFAPAAAHLSLGVKLSNLGPLVEDPLTTSLPGPKVTDQAGLLGGCVVHVDSFGNLITDISREDWIREVGSPAFRIRVGRLTVERLSRTFSDVRSGESAAYLGSSGYLEIAIRDGNAQVQGGVKCGDPVLVETPSAGA